MGDPAGDVIDPGGGVEAVADEAAEVGVDAGHAGLLEERRLPREPGGIGHDQSSVPVAVALEARAWTAPMRDWKRLAVDSGRGWFDLGGEELRDVRCGSS